MKQKIRYLALIPARGGSKEIPRKNIKIFSGKPLINWTIHQALQVKSIEKVIVSTDDEEISEIAKIAGASVPFMRPKDISGDSSKTEEAIIHAVNFLENKLNFDIENIILMQCTSPLRKISSIKNAIKKFEMDNLDSLLSVVEFPSFFMGAK